MLMSASIYISKSTKDAIEKRAKQFKVNERYLNDFNFNVVFIVDFQQISHFFEVELVP